MSLHSAHQRVLLALLAILIAVAGSDMTNAEDEPDIVRIEAGQMVEIGTDTASQSANFSWILTKDHSFQSAQRTRFFQTRLTQLGTYLLDVSVTDATVNQNEYRAFTIVVTEPGVLPSPPPLPSGPLKAIVTSDPPIINDTVYLPPQGGIVMVDASRSSGRITSYSLDLDSTVDADADGNAQNDRDNRDTFSEDSGSRIRYFMLPRAEPRSIWLTVVDAATGQTDRTSLTIAFAAAPPNSLTSQTNGQNTEILMKVEDRTASFSAELPEALTAGRQLLYEWDFGDVNRSLLFTPSHTYALPGTYTVALIVRDIATGQEVFSGTNSVQVFGAGVTSSRSDDHQTSSSASNSSSVPSVQTSLSIGSIMKVGIIILLLLALAIGLYFLFTWIKRKTSGTLEKTLENIEKTIVKPSAKAVVDVNVEPLKVRKGAQPAKFEDIADREKARTEFRTQARDNPVPTAAMGPVPSWLAQPSPSSRQGYGQQTELQSAGKASATPAPVPKPAIPAPSPKPATAPAAEPTPVPASLTPVIAKPTPPPAIATPTPNPNPNPNPAPAPASAVTPSPETHLPNKPDDDDTIAVIRADHLST